MTSCLPIEFVFMEYRTTFDFFYEKKGLWEDFQRENWEHFNICDYLLNILQNLLLEGKMANFRDDL